MSGDEPKKLRLHFHGRIIDSLGIQMYQSPVAAIAELIANAWDADATEVEIKLPDDLDQSAEVVVKDNGTGITFEACQSHYLNVGRDRRVEEGGKTSGGRPCLGRKGIGKFAGFGIAQVVEVATVSAATGERTVFRLDLNELQSSTFVSTEGKEIEVVEASGPDPTACSSHGTTIRLRSLTLLQRRKPEALAKQMARRFLLAQQAADFRITVNGVDLPRDEEFSQVQFDFPGEYKDNEKPAGLILSDGWGLDTLSDGNEIRWRIRFSPSPIDTAEFRGVSVFCGIKLAQAPFYFHLSGGLSGQHGEQYLFGLVQADYLDRGAHDVITTERQRINWEDVAAAPLLSWGQERLKSLLSIWKARRAEAKVNKIEGRIVGFSADNLQPSEAKTIKRALERLASIEAIDDPQFEELAGAMLTAWEHGKLRELVCELADSEAINAERLVELLIEEQVLSALHVLEIARAKIDVLHGLKERIAYRELELAVRNFIAKYPWLISPEWETFTVEKSVDSVLEKAASGAQLDRDPDWAKPGRVDLVLSAGKQLIVMEFMRPGLRVDYDHFSRFQRYVNEIRSAIRANPGLRFKAHAQHAALIVIEYGLLDITALPQADIGQTQQPAAHAVLQKGAAHRETDQRIRRVAQAAAVVEPDDIPDAIAADSALRDELFRQSRKQLFEPLAPPGKQRMGVLPLRNALARLRCFGQFVALDDGDPIVMLGRGACGQEAAHACTYHDSVPTTMSHGAKPP